MYIFRVILTCDRRYNTFDLKRNIKHYIEDLFFKILKIEEKKYLKNSKIGQN